MKTKENNFFNSSISDLQGWKEDKGFEVFKMFVYLAWKISNLELILEDKFFFFQVKGSNVGQNMEHNLCYLLF